MSPTEACPFCIGSAHAVRLFAQKEKEEVYLLACKRCGLEYLNPQPSHLWLSEQYASYYKRRESGTRPKLEFFSRLLRSLPVSFASKRVLEVGSAEGDCVVALTALAPTADITALEAGDGCSHHYRDLKCRFINLSIEHWLDQTQNSPGEKYEAILCFDLIEHLRKPIETVKGICGHLEDQGMIVATFPAADSLSRRILGRIWPQYKLEHLYYFSSGSIERLAQAAGLQTIRLQYLNKTLSIDYLLAVASGFGPIPFRKVSAWARDRIPAFIGQIQVTAGFGEYLWVAEKTRRS
ncbi:MAG: class I SAM-dependent methyltransferase [Bdellovibrionia bacterium]